MTSLSPAALVAGDFVDLWPRFYLLDLATERITAGLGAEHLLFADETEAASELLARALSSRAAAGSAGRWLGAMQFFPTPASSVSASVSSSPWTPFRGGVLFQPKILLDEKIDWDRTYTELHSLFDEEKTGARFPQVSQQSSQQDPQRDSQQDPEQNPQASALDVPLDVPLDDPFDYRSRVAAAVADIQAGHFHKLVCSHHWLLPRAQSRRLTWQQALRHLHVWAKERRQTAGAIYVCALSPSVCWLGCTPELLFQRKYNSLRSEAVAGTRTTYSDSPQWTDKELDEHQAVGSFIVDHLLRMPTLSKQHPLDLTEPSFSPSSMMSSITQSKPYLRAAGRLYHIVSDIRAVLPDSYPQVDVHLLDALHPTPALCGTPRLPAASWIAQHEPFSRGLYGGVVGSFGTDCASAYVAIRGALFSSSHDTDLHNDIHIYAGAGIVAASDPQAESDEIVAKAHNVISSITAATQAR